MSRLSESPDILMALRYEKEALQKEILASRQSMSAKLHDLSAPLAESHSRVEGFSGFVSKGLTIYQGIRIGMKVVSILRTMLGRKHRR